LFIKEEKLYSAMEAADFN